MPQAQSRYGLSIKLIMRLFVINYLFLIDSWLTAWIPLSPKLIMKTAKMKILTVVANIIAKAVDHKFLFSSLVESWKSVIISNVYYWADRGRGDPVYILGLPFPGCLNLHTQSWVIIIYIISEYSVIVRFRRQISDQLKLIYDVGVQIKTKAINFINFMLRLLFIVRTTTTTTMVLFRWFSRREKEIVYRCIFFVGHFN